MSFFSKIITALLFLYGVNANAQNVIPPPVTNESWSKDYDPFRIAGNLYYVGTYDLACYLITSSEGHILINTGLAESAPMIRRHVDDLGFKFSDIKILLTMQAHYDHVGAIADIQQTTGAKVMIDSGDAGVMTDGGNSDYFMGGKGSVFKPVMIDRLLHDGDNITLGENKLTVLHHPGHTKGSCSYMIEVKEKDHSYTVLLANMPTVIVDAAGLKGNSLYPRIAEDYAYTFRAMKNLKFDLWLTAHANQMQLHEKRKKGDDDLKIFMDRKKYDEMLKDLEEDYQRKLNNQ